MSENLKNRIVRDNCVTQPFGIALRLMNRHELEDVIVEARMAKNEMDEKARPADAIESVWSPTLDTPSPAG